MLFQKRTKKTFPFKCWLSEISFQCYYELLNTRAIKKKDLKDILKTLLKELSYSWAGSSHTANSCYVRKHGGTCSPGPKCPSVQGPALKYWLWMHPPLTLCQLHHGQRRSSAFHSYEVGEMNAGIVLFCFRTFRNLVRFQGVEITGLEVLCKDLTPGPTV